MFQWMSEIKLQKNENKFFCATLMTPHLSYAALNALIDDIAVTLMEKKVG
jgi:hypothetical protein